ncbi:MAG: Xaa-Pro peptidase family protein [Chloroflexota bacterium]
MTATMDPRPFGRHRTKISPMQSPSQEALEYAQSLSLSDLGPGRLAISEWQEKGLELPDMDAVRRYRLERIRQKLREFDYAGIILSDPLNVRYATDTTNMQIWCMHNAVRYCFIATDGPVILFDFHGCGHLSEHLDLIDEVRHAKAYYYMGVGPRYEERAEAWAADLIDLIRQYGGGNQKSGNYRVALDRANAEGIRYLERSGIHTFNGEEIMELARAIKSDEEIKAMRCSIAACETSMDIMRKHLVPGVSENRLWSYLHAENIARGGEWIETRLLASGPRTNPWFHESSSREIEEGDIMAFDTDLIGPYGYCCDISRAWICGEGTPTGEQKALYEMALEQIQRNTSILKAGVSFKELTERAMSLPEAYIGNRYSVLYHGVGLCDEYPSISYKEDYEASGYDGVLEENMCLCVESYIGRVGGHEGVKLEEQVRITKDGCEVLSLYPIDGLFGR